MKIRLGCVLGFYCLTAVASVSTDYAARFLDYQTWHDNLPEPVTPAFLTFIQQKTPLATKLREQWLYQLAKNKTWADFKTYYQPSIDKNLQCFYAIALYDTSDKTASLTLAHQLWQSSKIDPPACQQLFSLLFLKQELTEIDLKIRIQQAIKHQNLRLTLQLLKRYPKAAKLKTILLRINANPQLITTLPRSEFQSDLYLYGLKRLILKDISKAIALGLHPIWPLTEAEHHDFLKQVVLYKALRHAPDHHDWFQQLPAKNIKNYLLDWEIRAALSEENWPLVEQLILTSPKKEEGVWRYWLARAKEAQHHGVEAQQIYQSLMKDRNYYGFLAASRLKQPYALEDHPFYAERRALKPYQPILDQIQHYYLLHDIRAARILHDFNSELPIVDKIPLLYWLNDTLGWTHQALFLANSKEASNQLVLRFPLLHMTTVQRHAKNFNTEMAYIYAIIRQESLFKAEAESAAGARGLMQIMPQTASMIAKLAKITFSHPFELFLPEKNVSLGTAYLQYLFSHYQHPLLVTAAYNAGPKQVNHWLQSSSRDPLIWIETLPWRETRNYIKNVIAFYAVYQYRLQQKPNIDIFLQPIEIINDKIS